MVDWDFFLALTACLLILGEWTYVIVWTRMIGKVVTSKVLNAVTNLRQGRGTQPTAAETLASRAGPIAPVAGMDAEAILSDPRAQAVLEKISGTLGIPIAEVEAMAADYLGESPIEGGAPPPRSPRPDLPRGNTNPLAGILQGVLGGQVDWKQGLAAALPLFLQGVGTGGGGTQGRPESSGGSNW